MSRKSWTLLAVVLGSGTVFLDTTVVNVALPQMGRELPSTWLEVLEGQSYVYYGYLLTLSSLLILAGGLTDFYGRRRMFTVGLVGFGATSVLCGLAPTLELLVLFRILQGAAGAILVPGSLSIITAAFEGEERGRAFGVWAGASAATTIFGPILGGALVSYVSWRSVFFINVPLLALAVWATYRYMDESRDDAASGRFDKLGAVVVALAVGGLTFGVIRGQAQEWQDSAAYVSLAVGALATIAFPLMMVKRANPLVPPSLFKSRNFTVTNLSTLVIYGALYVTLQYFAVFAIGTIGYNELAFGIASLPPSIFLAVLSAKFGALAARRGPRVYMSIGPAIMGVGLLWFARFPSDSRPWVATLDDLASFVPPGGYLVDVLPMLVLFGIGLTIMVAPLTTALMTSVPVRHSGVASAVNNAISRVGPQLVGALLFVAISSTFYAALAGDARVEAREARLRDTVSPLNRPDQDVEPGLVAAARDASTDAFRLAMVVSAGLCLAGAAINAIGIRNPEPQRDPESAAAAPAAAGA